METNEKDLFVNLSEEERLQALRDQCVGSQVEKVRRYYSDDEKIQHKDYVAEESISLMEKEEEFSAIKKTFTTALKEYKGNIKGALKDLKRGYSENEETVFKIDDQTEGVMNVYDDKGKFLYSRKLFPDERQTTILSLEKTGTND